jgi:hypothetical protein
MTNLIHKLPIVAALVTSLTFVVVTGHAQTTTQPARTFADSADAPASEAEMKAEREKIWNSPAMLRARAWLQDYCSKSAKVTPEMAKRYQQELENMTPSQMEVWLLKFNEEEEQRQQQHAYWQQANEARLKQAMAFRQQTQQAYENINKAQTESALNAQQQINEQRENAQINAQNRMEEMTPAPYYLRGPGYYGGYGPYGDIGGTHYHYHLYP